MEWYLLANFGTGRFWANGVPYFWHFLNPKPYETWIKLDEEWVLRCDALLRLPGESKGADAEVAQAKKHRIPVYYSIEEDAAADILSRRQGG